VLGAERVSEQLAPAPSHEPLRLVIELPVGIELERVDEVVLVELVTLNDGGVSRATQRFAA
jgi:hypothetical protein